MSSEVPDSSDAFQPVLLGTQLVFEEEDIKGMITDENQCDVFVESVLFTGWMSKATFWELSGSE